MEEKLSGKEYLKLQQAAIITSLSIPTVKKLAKECGALRRIGRACRVHKQTLLSYIDEAHRE